MKYPNLVEEKKLWRMGYKRIAGLDEAGRGPLAGPVFAAAVIVKDKKIEKSLKEVRDSKELTEKEREKIYKILIKNTDIEWTVTKISERIIDKINIKNASEIAMERCVLKFKKIPDFLIIDGQHFNPKNLKKIKYKTIINADKKVFSCACASIIAKVKRDNFMKRVSKKYPQYFFDKHKGYGTILHKKMIKKNGPCKIHRKSFQPIKIYKKSF